MTHRPLLASALLLAFLAALVARAPSATADATADATAEARDHFRKGQILYGQKQYAAAVDEFNSALRLKHSASIELNLAQALRLAGRQDDALAMYEQYLTDYPTGPDAKEAGDWIEKLSANGNAITMTPASGPESMAASVPSSLPTSMAASAPSPAPFLPAPAPPPAAESATGRWWLAGGIGAVLVGGLVVGLIEATRPAIPPGTPGSSLGNQLAAFH